MKSILLNDVSGTLVLSANDVPGTLVLSANDKTPPFDKTPPSDEIGSKEITKKILKNKNVNEKKKALKVIALYVEDPKLSQLLLKKEKKIFLIDIYNHIWLIIPSGISHMVSLPHTPNL